MVVLMGIYQTVCSAVYGIY